MKKQIISASRRTDLIAYHLKDLKDAVRRGECIVPNPFNPRLKTRVSLLCEDVECIVFWTRNARPLLEDKEEFADGATFFEYLRGKYNFYFLWTITGYPAILEPGAPLIEDVVDVFKKIASELSPEKWARRVATSGGTISPVVWRFDPILISNITGYDFIKERFLNIARKLQGCCSRVVVSFYDYYRKSERRLSSKGIITKTIDVMRNEDEFSGLLLFLKETAGRFGLEIVSCCEELENWGIPAGKCIDDLLIYSLFGIKTSAGKDKGQRKLCRCVTSKDIGAYGTCRCGCLYCYAT